MASRNSQKAAARERRLEAERAAQQQARRGKRLRIVFGGVLAAGALAAVALVVVLTQSPAPKPQASIPAVKTTDLKAAAKLAGGTFTSYDWQYGTGNHVTSDVKYPMNPPTNGPHYPVPASDGNYVGAATPRTEELVHSLEHGRIEIQYRPGLPQAQIDQLVALYNEDPAHMLIFENKTDMDCDVAITAWGHGLLCKKFSPSVFDAARAFKDTYRDNGPEDVA